MSSIGWLKLRRWFWRLNIPLALFVLPQAVLVKYLVVISIVALDLADGAAVKGQEATLAVEAAVDDTSEQVEEHRDAVE